MSQTIYLAAIVVREERLLLVRPAPDAAWELPGGPLLPEHDDVDAGMDAILSAMGVNAPAIEDDFVHTIFMAGQDGPLVYNIYAPSEWVGEPAVPEPVGSGWFALEEVEALAMDDRIRTAILEAYGMREPVDDVREILSAIGGDVEPFRPGLRLVGSPNTLDTAGRETTTASGFSALADDFATGIARASTPPALDRRTRTLEVLAMLAALRGSREDLQAQINDVLNDGASPEQVSETLRLVGAYAGFPAAKEAWTVMEEIFVSRGIPHTRLT